jgi:hypothetical protein
MEKIRSMAARSNLTSTSGNVKKITKNLKLTTVSTKYYSFQSYFVKQKFLQKLLAVIFITLHHEHILKLPSFWWIIYSKQIFHSCFVCVADCKCILSNSGWSLDFYGSTARWTSYRRRPSYSGRVISFLTS